MVSPDGYIRLSFDRFRELTFTHLGSGCDPQFLAELVAQGIPASDAGFSEWISSGTPAISIGWGWFILRSQSQRPLLAPDCVRSNVMLINARGYDLGTAATSNLFRTWLDIHGWQDEANAVLHHSMNHFTRPAAIFG